MAEEQLESLGIETVAAHRVEDSVLGQVAINRRPDAEGAAQREKNVFNEIKAITGFLKSQNDAEDAGATNHDSDVVHAVMRNRLENLRSELRLLKSGRAGDASASAAAAEGPAVDGDAWSSDEGAPDAGDGPELLGGDLVETERERMIRLGLITPFDALQGLDRQVTRTATRPAKQLQEVDLFAPTADTKLQASAARYRQRNAAEAAAQPRTKLLDFQDLPHIEEEEYDAGRRPWNAARPTVQRGSGRDSAKRKRPSTLPKARKQRGVKLQASRKAAVDSGSDGGSGSASEGGSAESGDDVWDGEDDAEREGAYTTADGDDYDDADEVWYEERLQRWKDSHLAHPVGNVAVREAVGATEAAADDPTAQEGDPHGSGAGSGGDAATSPPAAAQRSGNQAQDAGANQAPAPQAASPRGAGAETAAGGPDVADDLDIKFDGGYSIPSRIYDELFPYQQVGVKWMWELHTQRAGGIIGDEMGLGKTVQVTAFLAGLHHSKLYKPTLIVAPVTTLKHWQRELRTWYPPFRVIVLHDTGRSPPPLSRPSREELVELATGCECGVLLTTYEQLRINMHMLLPFAWGYVILDEGHKIRNPDANITLVCKQVRTVHRVIMSGSPIQNSLNELWSLFDFVFPGKLGTLPVFQAQFAVPIAQGGYSNASPVAVSTAYKCAVMLRDLISPYLLRRQKVDVAKQLPAKNEQVLFCKLTHAQRRTYRKYLASRDVADILAGKRHSLEGITILRKICNHVDLLDRTTMQNDHDYGNPDRSGKLTVTLKVLDMWQEQGHKALLFTQTQQMLDIIERHVRERGFRYHRMDGCTAVGLRYRMMDDFNFNPAVFLFLLTTKVGGIGVNLTGANRVLLFDPDWNPSTDMQARERCWRLGQKRSVTIYRLITRGTIEEKVYHRQIYKQYLTNRILTDPRQKRFIASKDIHDLFTLTDHHHASGTETSKMFSALGGETLPEDVASSSSDDDDDGGQSGGDAQAATDDATAAAETSGRAGSSQHASTSGRGEQASARGTPKRKGKAHARSAGRVEGVDGVEKDVIADLHDKSEAAATKRLAQEGDGDASILRELFEGNGLHSALDHHAIESANDPVKRNAERTANKVAERAAQALKQSRQQVRQQPVHLPTWTGRHGHAGAPGQRRFGRSVSSVAAAQPPQGAAQSSNAFVGSAAGAQGAALPSTLLIARIKEKNKPAEPTPEEDSAQLLMAQIVSFLQAQEGHKALSSDLISHFENSVDVGSTTVFKQVLKQVATLRKRNGAPGYWLLKPEFDGR